MQSHLVAGGREVELGKCSGFRCGPTALVFCGSRMMFRRIVVGIGRCWKSRLLFGDVVLGVWCVVCRV